MEGEKLKYLRAKNSETQGDLAKILKVTQKAISKWETGSPIPVAYEKMICEHYDIKNEDKKEYFIIQLLEQLVENGIIKDLNNIDKFTEDMIMSAVKKEIEKIKEKS